MIDSPKAWRVALAASAINGVAFGSLYTFGAFFKAMATEFETGLGPTSMVFGVTVFLFFGTGAASGFLVDRLGPRPVVWLGGALFTIGLFLTSRVDQLWQGYLTYGLGAGFGVGLFVSPLFAVAAGWFDRYRGIATGIVATGSGIGTLVLLPLIERIVANQGWRRAFEVLALIGAVTFLVCGALVDRAPVAPQPSAGGHLRAVLATPTFRLLAICGASQSAAMVSAFAFIVPFTTDRGVSTSTAALLVGLIGASSIVGRLALSGFASRWGVVRTLQFSYLAQPVAFVIWLLSAGKVPALVAFVLLLGVAYGGFVALYPLVAAQLFGVRGLGPVMGWLFMSAGVGGLVGPPAVGFLADATSGEVASIVFMIVTSALGSLLLTRVSADPPELASRAET